MPTPIKIPPTTKLGKMKSLTVDDINRYIDPYGRISVVSNDDEIVLSPISQWDLSQKRTWPPPCSQAYCEKHFLQECLVYYSLETKKLKQKELRIDEWAAGLKKSTQKGNTTPTRVQPRRGAKETAVAKVAPAQMEPKELRKARSKLEALRREKELQLPWTLFSARVRAEIAQVSSSLYAHRQNKLRLSKSRKMKTGVIDQLDELKNSFRHERCPFERGVGVDCRYCQYRPTDLGGKEAETTRIAPVAPMHIIDAENFEKEQVAEFGGLKFAVDICGDEVKIILLDMPILELER
ncbi:hypothetical protein SCAR479_05304 [Seiridium cardinale]|uniref:Uncharacterized protein n=1 Tax=Seiridium cardinale TaxID=138064 RepID=A0ABR2XVY9_9PEZI